MIIARTESLSNFLETQFSWIPEKGETVEIVGNIPFHLQKAKRPLLGTITNVDGSYILVRPKRRKWEAEFYPGELRPVGKFKYKK
jgi:hypothetical protein